MQTRPACSQGRKTCERWKLASATAALGECTHFLLTIGHADAYVLSYSQECEQARAHNSGLCAPNLAIGKRKVRLSSLCLFRAQTIPAFLMPSPILQEQNKGKHAKAPLGVPTNSTKIPHIHHAFSGSAMARESAMSARKLGATLPNCEAKGAGEISPRFPHD